MDSDIPGKFSFAFLLAILFHFSVLAALMLAVNLESDAVTKPIAAMQATVMEMPAAEEVEANNAEAANKLSRTEKKRLAREKMQALRIQQAQKQKLLVDAAQKLVLETIQAKQLAQQIAAIEQKIKTLWNRPVATSGMACIIRVELSVSGQVKKVSVQQSSGNKFFDDAAKNAVYKAQPFQLPDKEVLCQKLLKGFPVYFGDK